MSDDKKYVLCPKCGVILEKGILFCSYCGANVEEKKQDDFYQKPVESRPIPQARPQTNYQKGFGRQSTATQDQEFVFDDKMGDRLKAEDKVRQATIFSYLALCIPFISIIFLGITIYFVVQARKVLGRGDPRLTRAITTAIFGTVIDVANIIILLNYFTNWIQF